MLKYVRHDNARAERYRFLIEMCFVFEQSLRPVNLTDVEQIKSVDFYYYYYYCHSKMVIS